jgi:hypothetical protein
LNKHPIQDRFKTQWVLLLTVLLAVSCVLAYTQLRMRESIIFDESVRLQTLTRVADQVLTVQVASADAALRTMRDGLDRWRSGDDYAPFAMEHLKRVEKMMPGARTFVVLNAQGRCQLSNRPELVGQMFNQRDYFVQAVASVATGEDVLTVSVPYRTALGVWAVTVSRAVVDNAGVITGVVAATLSPDYFQTLMTNMGHSPDMRISLIHGLGRMYVSSPVTERLMDTDFLQPGTFTKRHLDSGQVENVFEGVTVIQGGEQRLAAVRTVSMKDLGARHGFICCGQPQHGRAAGGVGTRKRADDRCHAGHGGIECGQSVVVPTLGGAFGAQGTACGSGTGGQPYQVRATGQHLALCVV